MELQPGLHNVDFTLGTEPRDYVIKITNNSGVKTSVISSRRMSVAWQWAEGWAETTSQERGDTWHVYSVDERGSGK